MAELHWFPVFVADWLTSDAITLMLPEQEGAFFRLLLRAWGKGVAEPCVPADDATLATFSRLGKRWGKLGGLIREQFIERDGYLYNFKLSEVWEEQQKKHGQAVVRGQNSAKARADKRQTVSKQSQDSGQQLERELEGEEDKSVPASWPADGAKLWTELVGATSAGRVGKALTAIVALHGWPAVRPDLAKWVAERKRAGRPCRVEWYASEASARITAPPPPAIVDADGCLTEYGERVTRPDKVPA